MLKMSEGLYTSCIYAISVFFSPPVYQPNLGGQAPKKWPAWPIPKYITIHIYVTITLTNHTILSIPSKTTNKAHRSIAALSKHE